MGSELEGMGKAGMSTDKGRRKRFHNGQKEEKYADGGRSFRLMGT